ncbi:MAG: PASTA domain-containing protein [Leptospiraceae bacterium]|nr:PASTA domain-containing protein [Leptospiraceae bacterium]MCP5511785.1 PASTA domain-containing protein [Leptospiraceae bacterium]
MIFFFAAFLVIAVRTRGDSTLIMPDLVGQNYIEVHNELMRLRLKVRLESKRYPDKNDGEILAQSISPGKKLESGSKLYLTVNNGVDRVIVPNLKGQQLNSAKAILDKVLSGETYVSMTIGGITYVPLTEGLTPDTIVDQIPEAGKNCTTREKVYLLVTEGANRVGVRVPEKNDLLGKPFPQIAISLNKNSQPFRIKEIVKTGDKRENGLVTSVDKKGDLFELIVSLFPIGERNYGGYETISFKPSKKTNYSAKVYDLSGSDGVGEELFSNLAMDSGEKFDYVFYRVGDQKVEYYDGDKKVDTFKFKADYKK